jgi:hypothetical protein
MAPAASDRQDRFAFRWSERDRAAWPYLKRVEELWNEWLSANEPTPAQAERKLLIDLSVHYEAAKYFGYDFRTAGVHEFAWFNDAASPIESSDDYRHRTASLQRYWARVYETQRTGELERAIFDFIVTGDVATSP